MIYSGISVQFPGRLQRWRARAELPPPRPPAPPRPASAAPPLRGRAGRHSPSPPEPPLPPGPEAPRPVARAPVGCSPVEAARKRRTRGCVPPTPLLRCGRRHSCWLLGVRHRRGRAAAWLRPGWDGLGEHALGCGATHRADAAGDGSR